VSAIVEVDAPRADDPAAGARDDALTGLRAVAALLVIGTHAGFWTGHYTPDTLGYLYARLEVGVAVFFVLSGYLLFRPWVRSVAEGRPWPSTSGYAWHRARRVLPAYWIVVLTTYLLYRVRDDGGVTGLGWSGLWRNLTLTQIYGFGHLHTGLTQMWSLAVEVSFYAALPLLAWLAIRVCCRSRWRPGLLIVVLCGYACVTPLWIVFTHNSDVVDVTARLWLPGFAVWFVGGMVLAVLAQAGHRIRPGVVAVGALAAFALACTPAAGEATIVPDDPAVAFTKSVLYLVVAMLLVAALTLGRPQGLLRRLCGWAPLVWLGVISYEIFLVHLVVIEFVMDMLGYASFQGSAVGVFVVTTVFSIPVAWALHRLLLPITSPNTSRN
jgi:peptidoglycan/LPS O-acetylase OafA/YrhL